MCTLSLIAIAVFLTRGLDPDDTVLEDAAFLQIVNVLVDYDSNFDSAFLL